MDRNLSMTLRHNRQMCLKWLATIHNVGTELLSLEEEVIVPELG